MEVTETEAELLKSNGIYFEGKIYNKNGSVIKIDKSDKERTESILAQMRNHKGLKK